MNNEEILKAKIKRLQDAINDILGTYNIYEDGYAYYLEISGTDYDFEIKKDTYEVLKNEI